MLQRWTTMALKKANFDLGGNQYEQCANLIDKKKIVIGFMVRDTHLCKFGRKQ